MSAAIERGDHHEATGDHAVTKAQLLDRLRECKALAVTDFELADVHAQRALLEYIADPDITRAFEAVNEREHIKPEATP